jgi:serine phosphatase RsbU (regulator of sigma subunit)
LRRKELSRGSPGFAAGVVLLHGKMQHWKLAPGDRVLVYSNGLAEATGLRDEEYRASRFAEILRSSDVSAREVIADVQRFTAGRELPDDATAIVIRR